jgi:8-oxo-dGTP diphosphatase
MPNTGPDVVHVAAGILHDPHGRVLIAQRPPGRILAGKWEFPGGKIQPGETAYQALVRELHEELGIEVRAARPLIQLHHRYTHRDVRLDVFDVTDYRGVVHGREGQAIEWTLPEALDSVDLLDADAPIVRALRLPPLYVISDARRLGETVFLQRLEQALAAGLRLIQVREPTMAANDFQRLARAVVAIAHRFGARVLVNAEPSRVAACGADGVHLNGERLRSLQRRPLPADLWVGASCHNAEELARAAAIGADFAVLGPVLPTTSHPRASTLGWSRFHDLCSGVNLPVYALGGLVPADLSRARECGAQGLAMISGIWGARSIAQAVASVM